MMFFSMELKQQKIFCRPSCKSRIPNRENVEFFLDKEEALKAGYRSCKRCKSGGERVPDDEWTDQIKDFIEKIYREHLTLDIIASECHGSPYHLHRVFKKQMGITPLSYLHQIRIEKAQELLVHHQLDIQKIGEAVGIPNSAQFSTLFKKITKMTPSEYRRLKVERNE
ncbi:Bifunctional transcriptional activator/DNA repair enzyme AdaA [Carnobacterium maltaromaticum]|nr:Bifunctional transcriptional activator/DNA repair enzyme AdaA [Carnobacterium maltaromaticum]